MRRVLVVAESFLPAVNGVTRSVLHVGTELRRRGVDVLVVAPGPLGAPRARAEDLGIEEACGLRVHRVPSLPLPLYPAMRVTRPARGLDAVVRAFRPDVVHAASPLVLGGAALTAARARGIPTVAVHQTDIAGFARSYGLHAGPVLASWMRRVHGRADRNLAPSSAAAAQLAGYGVQRVHLWGRGVDGRLFHPGRRSQELRQRLSATAGAGTTLVGYAGRLAREKELSRLVPLAAMPGVQLVLVGDGPDRARLASLLPGALFLGHLEGVELATAVASLDVFVHTGTTETFCQGVQEAQASGVPVVAPAAGGPLDLIVDERTGLLFDPDDPRALKTAVRRYLAGEELRRDVAAAAREGVRHRTWSALVDVLVEHYADVVAEARRGSAGAVPTH